MTLVVQLNHVVDLQGRKHVYDALLLENGRAELFFESFIPFYFLK